MEFNIQLEQFTSRPLAVVRRRCTLQEFAKVIPEACGIVWNVLRAQNVKGAGRQVALYWDDVSNLEIGVPNWDIYGHWKHEWSDDPTQIRTDVSYLVKTDQ